MSKFPELVEIIKKLRDPVSGCPWDLEQTHKSIRQYFIEETYEAIEAIDAEDDEELSSELGDVLLQVMLHSQIASDRKAFNIEDVIGKISEKMIRRHPHVFGDATADSNTVNSSEEVKKNWEEILKKMIAEEKAEIIDLSNHKVNRSGYNHLELRNLSERSRRVRT